MKKYLLLLILAIIGLQPVSAQSYRGFADIEGGYTFNLEGALIGVTTTHGLQLAQKFFIGAGTGILTDAGSGGSQSDISIVIPLYADFRFDFFNGKKVSPFVDLKVGYTADITSADFGVSSGLYLKPTIGFRIRLTERTGINIGLAYSHINAVDNKWYITDNTISIKAGIDF